MSNSLIVGYTNERREPRAARQTLFPFVDILQGGTAYTSFGSEPFTVQNELRYNTFQLQDSFMKFSTRHTLTFGVTTQKYHSDNVFWSCCPQSNYTSTTRLPISTPTPTRYLANPNRTTSARRRAARIQGALLERPRPRQAAAAARRLVQRRLRAGRVAAAPRPDRHRRLQARRPRCSRTPRYQNANADALTFRDETGSAGAVSIRASCRTRRSSGRRAWP